MIFGRPDYTIENLQQTIGQDEPIMPFRAHDALMPAVLAYYANLLRQHCCAPRMIDSVLAHEQRVRQWQRMNGCKLPDIPEEAVSPE